MANRQIQNFFVGASAKKRLPLRFWIANGTIMTFLQTVQSQLTGIGNLPWEVRGNDKLNGSSGAGDTVERTNVIAAQHLRIYGIGGTCFLLFFFLVIFVVAKELIMRQRRLRKYRYNPPVPKMMVKDLTIPHNKRRPARGASYGGATLPATRNRSLRDVRTGGRFIQPGTVDAGGQFSASAVNEKRRKSEHGRAGSIHVPHNLHRYNISALHVVHENEKVVQPK